MYNKNVPIKNQKTSDDSIELSINDIYQIAQPLQKGLTDEQQVAIAWAEHIKNCYAKNNLR